MKKTLTVRAVASGMCPDFEAQGAGILRFIGRSHDPSLGDNGGWTVSPDPVTVPFRSEYVQELKAGALLPADAETAALCGLPFSPAG